MRILLRNNPDNRTIMDCAWRIFGELITGSKMEELLCTVKK